uniref:GST C-terminal domain-containing protein n=1 Tax=Paulinella longichromatophora TaxID=1708747 RepID=A0A2H4ZQ47_9EUKA|nr:hypothetical protein PLO_677 [Paulinella longichromatophora]
MHIPPLVVTIVRNLWYWEWKKLMNGLGPADKSGNYTRPKSKFSEVLQQSNKSIERSRFILVVGRSCPWAHRAWLVWTIRNLRDTIKLVVVEPDRKQGRWRFVTPLHGCNNLNELYLRCGSTKSQRATVPMILDEEKMTIVCNESAQMVELLNNWPALTDSPELMPNIYQRAIEDLQEIIQPTVNDGVYRCGFARKQIAYDKATKALFCTLRNIEDNLSKNGPWLCGHHITLSDIRLFPTLIRWELVYAPLFGCSRQFLWQFPAIWKWRQRLFSLPGVAESCDAEAIVSDYFGSLFPLNPSGIIPDSPNLAKLVLTLIPDPRNYE